MDYILIRAWGQFMGFENWQIRDQLATAHEDNASGNVIYKRTDGLWATIEDVKGIQRVTVERMAAAIQKRDNPDDPNLPKKEII